MSRDESVGLTEIGTQPPCSSCPARCCKYFALQIDHPVTPEDFDKLRWYLLHENVTIWVQDGDWFLEVRNRCRGLTSDDRCCIYRTRPDVCREYGSSGENGCEYFTDDLEFDLHFESAEALQDYARVTLEKRARRLARRRELYRRRKAES